MTAPVDAGAERGDDVDPELGAGDVHPQTAGPGLVVPDGREGDAAPRPQQQVDEGDRTDRHAQGQPEHHRLPGIPVDPAHAVDADPRASAQPGDLGHEQPVDLGDDPRAHREIAAAKPEGETGGGYGEEGRDDPRDGHADERVDAHLLGRRPRGCRPRCRCRPAARPRPVRRTRRAGSTSGRGPRGSGA